MEVPRLQTLWDNMGGRVQVVAVNLVDTEPELLAWLAGIGVTFPVLHDPTWSIAFAYAYVGGTSLPLPKMYVIGPDMVIRKDFEGAAAMFDQATLEGHVMDVAYMRDPLDIEMVMDVSDSMNSPSPSDPGGDSKLIMMRQAATMIADFLHDHGQGDDSMGLVWFTDDASEYEDPVSHDNLLSVQTYGADLRTQIETRGTGTCTAMGAGLQTAFNTLVAEGVRDRFVILCTDGMQNIEPKVAPVGGHFEIIDSGGWLCGGHSSVPPHPGVNITSYDTRIHPIGIGITATYASLLQDIANATGGFYRGTDDPDVDLDLIYFLDLCNCMAGGSPAVVHHNAGKFYPEKCQAIESFYLNRSARKVTAMLSWKRAQGSNLTFWLRAPDGSLLDLHHQMRLFEDHCLATFYLPRRRNGKELPHVGEWRMIIRGETKGSYADYHAFIIAEDQEVKYHVDYPREIYMVGDRLPITIKLTELKEPILKVKEILVEMAHLRVPLEKLLAEYEIGVKPEEMGLKEYPKDPTLLKLVAMTVDPKFRENLEPVRSKLSLQARELEYEIGKESIVVPMVLKQPGLHSFKVVVHGETARNGPIHRLDLVSVHVAPGKAAL